jgi:N-acetylmuramic acid 6-phosphate etherase
VTAALTENLHERAEGLDRLPLHEVATILAEAQINAASAVRASTASICNGAAAMAKTLRNGGRIHYIAAGSSGLMAAADAQELGGTFSIPASQLRIHMAGGLPTGVEMPGGTEDDTIGLMVALSDLTSDDVVIAVSASGSTPFTTAAAQIALGHQAVVIGIANNAGSELLEMADHPILLETPPEVLSGSTRMGAGTAQKIALNILSTLMAVELGHVHDGMMVNLHADNKKLRQRANSIVQKIASSTEQVATRALDAAGGDVKVAVLMAANDISQAAAVHLLEQTDGHLRTALERSKNT